MRNFLLVFLSALLFGLAFIQIGVGFLSFFAFIPYLYFITTSKPKQAFFYGFLFGFFVTLITLYGVYNVKLIAFIGLIIALPLYFAIFSSFLRKVYSSFPKVFIWIFPILWIGMEYLMTLGSLNFPWLNAGYCLSKYYLLIQAADIFGIYGLSILVMYTNVLLFQVLHGKKKSFYAIFIILILWFGYGILRDKTIELERTGLKIGVIQLNVQQEDKWKPENLESTVADYENQIRILSQVNEVDLIILPESAIPTYVLHEPKYKNALREFAKENKVNIIFGFPDYKVEIQNNKPTYKFYNSATLIDTSGDFQVKYNKIRLVPFGERIPLLNTFPILRKLQFGQANFEFGTEYPLYTIDSLKFSTLICFEGVFPELSRNYAKKGANVLVVITNDAWFKRTRLPYEHANNTKIRAIETRLPLIRAANTGISYVFNPKGKVVISTDIFEKINITSMLNKKASSKPTFFVTVGYIFPILCFWFSIIIIIISIILPIFIMKRV
ncbi:MAG TPA: apolipoprotein N-acyltransferase [Candidatus Cloacimonetes bacterium]|nr:apolipoprotein N-acyltransferase [Candidatus Cloacimonadota bacterium]HEX37487.1 apolipoprotein N-acyltransferase [Candidatus Cloacimonadota bacterium]